MGETILVTGGNGTLGRLLVRRLLAAGHGVRSSSRSGVAPEGAEGVAADFLAEGGGRAAVDGIGTVIHCASAGASGDGQLTRNLLRVAEDAGVRRILHVSVVGCADMPIVGRIDRLAFGYFGEKKEAEEAVRASALDWTILRSTQFHELMLGAVTTLARLWVAPLPAGFRFQTIAADEVAARLVEMLAGGHQGLDEIGGPQVLSFAELLAGYFAATGRRPRPVLPLPVPGRGAAAYRAGVNLAPRHAIGRETWAQFLARQ